MAFGIPELEDRSKQPDNKTLREMEAKEGEVNHQLVQKSDDGSKEIHFYPDRPTQRVHKDRFIAKEPSRYYDPCQESSQIAIKCMSNHDEDYKEVCAPLFEAYRDCKKAWQEQRKKDLRNGGIW